MTHQEQLVEDEYLRKQWNACEFYDESLRCSDAKRSVFQWNWLERLFGWLDWQDYLSNQCRIFAIT
jgi:hypothetical protein